MLREVPNMKPEDLEKILAHLPDPYCVNVVLNGEFDYSGIRHQIEQEVKGLNIPQYMDVHLELFGFSRKQVVDVYKHSASLEEDAPRGIFLKEMLIYSEKATIIIRPTKVSINYNGREPPSITAIRKELSGINVGQVFNIG